MATRACDRPRMTERIRMTTSFFFKFCYPPIFRCGSYTTCVSYYEMRFSLAIQKSNGVGSGGVVRFVYSPDSFSIISRLSSHLFLLSIQKKTTRKGKQEKLSRMILHHAIHIYTHSTCIRSAPEKVPVVVAMVMCAVDRTMAITLDTLRATKEEWCCEHLLRSSAKR